MRVFDGFAAHGVHIHEISVAGGYGNLALTTGPHVLTPESAMRRADVAVPLSVGLSLSGQAVGDNGAWPPAITQPERAAPR